MSNLPDNFLNIFRNDKTTPYTNLASSLNGRPELAEDEGGNDTCTVGGNGVRGSSFTATTTPDDDMSVLRGLEFNMTVGLTSSL